MIYNSTSVCFAPDVFAAHSEDFKNVVACMGTSVTKEQLELISKYTNKTILCLDSDIAGRRASVNNLIKLINSDINFTNLNLEIEIASIIEGKDPDELIRNNPSDWKKVIDVNLTSTFLLSKYSIKKMMKKKVKKQ